MRIVVKNYCNYPRRDSIIILTRIVNMSEIIADSTRLEDQFEHLRLILESEQQRTVTYGEAVEVGDSLLSFFQILAEDVNAI